MNDERRSAPLFLALGLGAAGYVAAHSLHWPVVNYLPVTGEWTLHEPAGAISMHYFGVVLWGLAFAALGYAIGSLPGLTRRVGPRVLATFALSMLGGGLVYFLVRELTEWS